MPRSKPRCLECRESSTGLCRRHRAPLGELAAGCPCMWFAGCRNAAVTTQAHPVLGDVPICQRCKDWYDRMGEEVKR